MTPVNWKHTKNADARVCCENKKRDQKNGCFRRLALSCVSRPSGAFRHSDVILYSLCRLRLIRGISGAGFSVSVAVAGVDRAAGAGRTEPREGSTFNLAPA